MARPNKLWFRESRKSYYVEIDGKQHKLGSDKEEATRLMHELLGKKGQEPKPAAVAADQQLVVEVIDKFLDFCLKKKAAGTYKMNLFRTQSFSRTISPSLTVAELRPFHVQEWIDRQKSWSDGMKRDGVITVQRAFNWAEKLGYIDKSPIRHMEKQKQGRRDRLITPEEYAHIMTFVSDQEFKNLLEVSWTVGCRPQESLVVEARHVDLAGGRWVFPPEESKGKKRHRIVYLNDKSLEVTKRLMEKNPTGPLFRNADGKPWKPYSINCRFCRL